MERGDCQGGGLEQCQCCTCFKRLFIVLYNVLPSQVIALALASNTSIVTLDMSPPGGGSGHIGSSGMEALAQVLLTNDTLTELDLRWVYCCTAAGLVYCHRTLAELDLRWVHCCILQPG